MARRTYGAGPQNHGPSSSSGTGDADGVQVSTTRGSASHRGQQPGGQRVVQADGGVGEHQRAGVLLAVHPQPGEEARHRAAVSNQRRPVAAHDLHPQPVCGPAGVGRIGPGGQRHLLDGVRGEHVAGVPEQKGAEAPEVGGRRPELPGGGHHARVVLGLGQHDVGPGMRRRRPRRPGRSAGGWCASHAQREQRPVPRGRRPTPARRAARPARRAARTPGWSSGSDGRREGRRRRRSAAGRRARCPACAPTTRRGSPPATGEVRQQLADRPVAQWGARQVALQPVVEVEGARVAQAEHGDRRDGLRDRPEPVLDVGVRLLDRAPSGRPRQPTAADHGGDPATAPARRAGRGRCGRAGCVRWWGAARSRQAG